jgi:hypothetical protein
VRSKTYLDWEQAFHFIWQNAGRDGIWQGNAASLAKEFDALEDDAKSVLDELRERRLHETTQSTLFTVLLYLHSTIAYAMFGMNSESPKIIAMFQRTLNSMKPVERRYGKTKHRL